MNIEFAEKFKALAKQTVENTSALVALSARIAALETATPDKQELAAEPAAQPEKRPVGWPKGKPRKAKP